MEPLLRDVATLGRNLNARSWPITFVQTLAALQVLRASVPFPSPNTYVEWEQLLRRAEKEWRASPAGPADSLVGGASPFNVERGAHSEISDYWREMCRLAAEVSAAQAPISPETAYELIGLAADQLPGLALPSDTSQLVARTADTHKGDTVYCAFSATGETALRLGAAGASVDLDVPEVEWASFWSGLSLLLDLQVYVRARNPFFWLFENWTGEIPKYDVVIATPPWGQKLPMKYPVGMGFGPTTSESWGVNVAARMATRIGLCLVPAGFLFRSGVAEQALRDKMIQRYSLSAVISLPSSAINWTAAASALLAFTPGERDENVLFVDGESATEEGQDIPAILLGRRQTGSSEIVPLDMIAKHSFNLTPHRYVLSLEERRIQRALADQTVVPLGDIAEIYRPQALPAAAEDSDAGEPVYEVAVSDLDLLGLARAPKKVVSLEPGARHQVSKARLQPGDVLLVTKGSVGRVGFVRDIPEDQVWAANQSFAILRLRPSAPIRDARVLFRYLRAPLAQTLIQRFTVVSTIPNIQMKDIKQLQVLLPSPGDQIDVANEVEALFQKQDDIDRLQQELRDWEATLWPANLESFG